MSNIGGRWMVELGLSPTFMFLQFYDSWAAALQAFSK